MTSKDICVIILTRILRCAIQPKGMIVLDSPNDLARDKSIEYLYPVRVDWGPGSQGRQVVWRYNGIVVLASDIGLRPNISIALTRTYSPLVNTSEMCLLWRAKENFLVAFPLNTAMVNPEMPLTGIRKDNRLVRAIEESKLVEQVKVGDYIPIGARRDVEAILEMWWQNPGSLEPGKLLGGVLCQLDISPSEFAEKVGVDEVAARSWLNGTRLPNRNSVNKIRDVLGFGSYQSVTERGDDK